MFHFKVGDKIKKLINMRFFLTFLNKIKIKSLTKRDFISIYIKLYIIRFNPIFTNPTASIQDRRLNIHNFSL